MHKTVVYSQCEFSEGKQESAVALYSQPSIETVSKLTVFLNPDIPVSQDSKTFSWYHESIPLQGSLGNEEEPSSGSGTECYSDPPSHKSIDILVYYQF